MVNLTIYLLVSIFCPFNAILDNFSVISLLMRRNYWCGHNFSAFTFYVPKIFCYFDQFLTQILFLNASEKVSVQLRLRSFVFYRFKISSAFYLPKVFCTF